MLAEDTRLHEPDRVDLPPQRREARARAVPEPDRRVEQQREPGLADARVHIQVLDDRERLVERPDALEDLPAERAGLERLHERAPRQRPVGDRADRDPRVQRLHQRLPERRVGDHPHRSAYDGRAGLLHHRDDPREVVGGDIRVAVDPRDDLAARLGDRHVQRRGGRPARVVEHPDASLRVEVGEDRERPVGRAAVRHKDLVPVVRVVLFEERARQPLHVRLLVEQGNDDRDERLHAGSGRERISASDGTPQGRPG